MKKPRGRCTPYAFFLNVCREKCAKKIAAKVDFKTLSRICWEKWQVMTEYQKTRFVQMSKYDEIRFKKEMVEYKAKKKLLIKKQLSTPEERISRKSLFTCNKTIKVFSAEEDSKLLKGLEECPEGIIVHEVVRKLSHELKRRWSAVHHRMEKLQRGSSKRGLRMFTLEEDMLIIDLAVEVILKGYTLQEANISNLDIRLLADSLTREDKTMRDRWIYLKTWLQQYYHKTLNLDVRPMLVNVLADNFESEDQVDWDFVLKCPEFSGHSTQSLRKVLHDYFRMVSRNMRISRNDLSFKQVVQFTKENYKPRKVPEKVQMRQAEIIKYFEEMVKSKGITNFLQQ